MKVLIVSHNPVTTQNNMGKTFLSLFSCFERQELCQLYIYPTLPNQDRCAAFYRITDKEVLQSLGRFRRPGGRIDRSQISEVQGLYEDERDEAVYRDRKNKSPLRRMLRDAMWKCSGWYSPDLRSWLEEQQPEVIFVAPGVAKFLYDMALKISKRRHIPLVTYICDEYYFVKKPRGLAEKLRLGLLRRKIEQLMARTAHLTVICDELKQAYSQRFRVETTTLMTGASAPPVDTPRLCPAPRTISYFGNIRLGRYRSLAQIGQALDDINAQEGTDYRLKIYTSEKDSQILAAFQGLRSVELCGFVTGADFQRTFAEAELLLHTEDFDPDSIDAVRHSVSTKIADSLASGIPLLAYGPAEVASMGHLLRNGCAITATSPEALRPMLLRAFDDETVRTETVGRALAVAKGCHDSAVTSRRLRAIIGGVIDAQ